MVLLKIEIGILKFLSFYVPFLLSGKIYYNRFTTGVDVEFCER